MKKLKKLGQTPFGGTQFSGGVYTHPVKMWPVNEPVAWRIFVKSGYDDYKTLFEGKTEQDCLAFLESEGSL